MNHPHADRGPLIASEVFKITSTTLVVSFIVSFGVVKAITNLVSGHFADLYGRKHMLRARMDHRPACAVHDRLGAELGLDHCGQCAARHQSGTRLVDDHEHEGRSQRWPRFFGQGCKWKSAGAI